jgi:hypothetical protein
VQLVPKKWNISGQYKLCMRCLEPLDEHSQPPAQIPAHLTMGTTIANTKAHMSLAINSNSDMHSASDGEDNTSLDHSTGDVDASYM